MKVLLINSHQFGNVQTTTWDAAQVFAPTPMSTYTQYLVGEFYKLGVPVIHAHDLPGLGDKFAEFMEQAPDYSTWYDVPPTAAQRAYSCYYRAVCTALAQAGNSYWVNDQAGQARQLRTQATLALSSYTQQYLELLTQLEAAVSLDYEGMGVEDLATLEQQILQGKVINRSKVSANSAAKITRAQAIQEQQANAKSAPTSIKLNDGTSIDLAGLKLAYPASVLGLQQQCIFATLASKVDWKTRAHEWILVLDEQAILHPQFFNKISLLLQYKISPEVLVLGEAQIEQQLATELAAQGMNLAELLANEGQVVAQVEQLEELLTQLGVNPRAQRSVESEVGSEVVDADVSVSSGTEFESSEEWEDEVDEDAEEATASSSVDRNLQDLVSNPQVAKILTNLQTQGAQVWQNRVAQQCAELWNDKFVAEQEYKRAYQRYSERFKCYFFVKRTLGYVTPATVVVRANVFGQMAQMSQQHPYALVNDAFARNESHGFETAYVRGVWAVAPQQLTYLHPSKRDKSRFFGFITRWANNTNAYVQQLKLTASLDSGDLLNQ